MLGSQALDAVLKFTSEEFAYFQHKREKHIGNYMCGPKTIIIV